MELFDRAEPDLDAIRLERWGRVEPSAGVVPWIMVDPQGRQVEPVVRFLRDFVARGNSAGSVRSYAYGLLRWWRFLRAVGVEWDQATGAESRDFVLWLMRTVKPRRSPRTGSADLAGRINPVTRKRHLDDGYQPRTVRHSNAVLRSFYEFWIERGEGPLVNPVPRDRPGGGRPDAHHNPLLPFRAEGRLRYNPRVPRQAPRAMPDERWTEFFASLRSNRDRAIMAIGISTGGRAGELLGMAGADVDWGDQLVRVCRKGSRACQWLPASQESFVWLRLYWRETGGIGPDDRVRKTLRRRRAGGGPLGYQDLNYAALRAVIVRANQSLGSNWSMHDLRHTCALRMARGQQLSLRDIQVILGHAELTTTQIYLQDDDHEVIQRVRAYLSDRAEHPPGPPRAADGYDPAALSVLFGGAV
jgi:integrase/recombinase XerD